MGVKIYSGNVRAAIYKMEYWMILRKELLLTMNFSLRLIQVIQFKTIMTSALVVVQNYNMVKNFVRIVAKV